LRALECYVKQKAAVKSSTETFVLAERAIKRGADWCVVGHGYQAINPTPIGGPRI
jgi:hypothetical protein